MGGAALVAGVRADCVVPLPASRRAARPAAMRLAAGEAAPVPPPHPAISVASARTAAIANGTTRDLN
jgi:hypothetical protein